MNPFELTNLIKRNINVIVENLVQKPSKKTSMHDLYMIITNELITI